MSSIDRLKNKITEFEKIIDYTFKNKDNIILALTHSSYANENKNKKISSNERLEFLGDAILNITISEKIYKEFPELAEGDLTKTRASIVCEQALMKCSNNLKVGKYLLLGKGEEQTGGRTRMSILSDAFEALLGAIYIDGGMENVKNFIYKQMDGIINDAAKGIINIDYKTQLQENIQKSGETRIIYEIVDEKGPDHNKIFVSQIKVADKVIGVGEGKSKKEAEQNAAKAALSKKW